MLDDDANDPTTTTDPAGGADQAPPTKAVRRRRATKATAAPAPEQAALPAEEPAAAPEPDVAAPGDADSGDGPAPAKRARKAPAKKAAPRKRVSRSAVTAQDDAALTGPPAQVETGAAASEEAAVLEAAVLEAAVLEAAVLEAAALEAAALAVLDPLPVEPAVDLAEPVDAAPTRSRRRRAPASVTFQAPADNPSPATEDVPADAEGETVAPRRRRRAGTAGALPASALAPTLLAPEPAPAEAVGTGEPGNGPDSDDDEDDADRPRRRRRGRRGRGVRRDEGDEPTAGEGEAEPVAEGEEPSAVVGDEDEGEGELNADGTRRRRRRRRRGGSGGGLAGEETADDVPTVVHVREPRAARVRGASAADEDGVRGITGSTRMAAKRARRQEGRDSGRRRPPVLSEAEFLARREAVDRTMVVRQQGDRTQIAVLEDGVLVEHYVTKASAQAYAGNVYLGKVQNVLPSMEAAFVDIGKGKNGVLYAGEVNYDAQLAGHGPRKIEQVLKSGQDVLVQVSKDPIGHKGARLTSQVSLPGRYLVYVPEGSMTGISRKLPDTERARLKAILKKVVPEDAGVIIRTAAEGASEEDLTADVLRLQGQWELLQDEVAKTVAQGGAPVLLHAEPDLVVRVVRDVFNEDFTSLVVQGDSEWDTIKQYVDGVAPDLAPRISRHGSDVDVFAVHRIDEQLAKALDRKVWLPSGGSLVIDRTEAMIVIDVNTGKYVGKGGNLEETVTRNNLEAAEEIARQLRLRDLGGIIVVDFIDMVLESNRDLVVRRLVECLGRDRTKHQVAEVTSLGLVQMTRKRVGQGLLESFSETCEACGGRGVLVHAAPVDSPGRGDREGGGGAREGGGSRDRKKAAAGPALVAAASHKVSDDGAAEESDGAETTDPGAERAPSRGRRRRGGRGAGAAGAAAALEAQQDARVGDGAHPVDDAPLAPAPLDLADLAPDLVPELADQPPTAQEDVPVLPGDDEQSDVSPVDPAPVDVEQQPEPAAAQESVEPLTAPQTGADQLLGVPDAGQEPVAEGGAAPRRRRRATSRPAGPA